MVGILFLILKIIGILLLSILLFLLLIAAILLLVPVRYRFLGRFYEEKQVQGHMTWFLSMIHLVVQAGSSGYSFEIRIFGKNLEKWKQLFRKRKKKRPKRKTKEEKAEIKSAENQTSGVENQNPVPEEERKSTEDNTKSEPERDIFIQNQHSAHDRSEKKGISGWQEEIRQRILRMKKTVEKLFQSILEWRDKKEKIMAVFFCEETNAVKGQAVLILKKLWKHTKPSKMSAHLRFGMEYPDLTGQIYAFICLLYGYDGKNVKIEPDFEHQVLEGRLDFRGRIRLANFLYYVISAYRIKGWKQVLKSLKEV